MQIHGNGIFPKTWQLTPKIYNSSEQQLIAERDRTEKIQSRLESSRELAMML